MNNSILFGKNRSDQLELMDFPIHNKEDLFQNLRELERINKLTGGPASAYRQIKKYFSKSKSTHFVDVGFGAGDMMAYLYQKKLEHGLQINLTGLDIMPEALEYVHKSHSELVGNCSFFVGDYADWFKQGHRADIAYAGLFTHHLTDDQLLDFLITVTANTKGYLIINDLHRHPIAYYAISLYVKWFTESPYTKNDAPLSVLRSFKRRDWHKLLKKAGIKEYSIQWKWAYRFAIVIKGQAKG